MRISHFLTSTALAAGALSTLITNATAAQDQSTDEEIEEVVVTGSYIRGRSQENSASPLAVVNSSDLNAIGATQIADLVQTLTINNGSQNNPDAFTQNSTTGTANFNLRGLGIASTLVLLNGRRQVVTAAVDNDGVQFVDTNSLIPQIAIGRVEIVKDGAAAIYGSDAVAGVVNIITDDNFEGLAVTGRYGFVTDEGTQDDTLIQAKFGWGNDKLHFLAAGSYFDRTALTTAERRLSTLADDLSGAGNPGSFNQLNNLGLPPTIPVLDPTGCSEFGGIPFVPAGVTAALDAFPTLGPGLDAAGLTPGVCGFDFGDFFNLVPEEERIQLYAAATYDINDTTTFRLEGAYANNEALRGNSPTFPFLLTNIVPDTNPFNIFGTTVGFIGRPLANNAPVSPNITENDTFRVSGSLNGEVNIGNGWNYDLAVTFAENNHFRSTEDTNALNFQSALGFELVAPGTPGAEVFNGVSFLPTAGLNGEFFNPFATSFTAFPNSAGLIDQIVGLQTNDAQSQLLVIDAVVSGSLFELPAGSVELALGFQYRDESSSSDLDPVTNAGGFGFVATVPIPDFDNSRTPYAFFAEALVPLTETLEFSGALRFEDYGGGIGSTLDPKFTLRWFPTDTITFRGSYSTSFRAPSVFQQFGVNASLNEVDDPITGASTFALIITTPPTDPGGRDLEPEQSEAFNFGVTWLPTPGLNINVDYFNYSFSDAIVTGGFQDIVDNDPLGDAVQRSLTGTILAVNTDFTNASNIDTSGIDLSIKYDIETDIGTFQPFFEGTWVADFDFTTPLGTEVAGLGSRNFGLLGTGSRPTPEFRFNTGLSFVNALHEARVFVRFIDSIEDNENPGSTVDSHTTVDVQYALNLGEIFEKVGDTRLTIGVINLFDQDPPAVATNGGFESRLFDPRGRVGYVELGVRF